MNTAPTPRRREKYLQAFLMGFLAMMLTLIPFMLFERGNFIYYGDFNAQQIPFYNLLNDAIGPDDFLLLLPHRKSLLLAVGAPAKSSDELLYTCDTGH